jgi:EpsD family peptidyl-prolyl cis-trans isomerase
MAASCCTSSRPRASLRWLVASLVVVLASAGCHRVGGDATQVAARVNDAEISLSQLQYVLQRQPAVPPGQADALTRNALEGLIEQELAAQGARSLGLDKDPRVVQAVEAAKREVLAKSYRDALAEKAKLPSSDEIDRYYDSQPALFAQRRFYTLVETSVPGSAADLDPVVPLIEAGKDAQRVTEVLRDAHLRSNSRQLTLSPEDVPLLLVGRLAQLRDGQSMVLRQPGGLRVLTLLSSAPAPLTREAARPAIQAFLANEHKRQAVRDGAKALRDAASIQYKGKFAQAASQPVAGDPAASAP